MALILIASLEFARILSGGDACDGLARVLPAPEYSRPGLAWTPPLHAGAGAPHPAGDMAMPATFELHFQEGFAGETVEIVVDGAVVARFEARTRMQTGLAHIERLDLSPGDVVTIRIGDGAAPASITASKDKPFININFSNSKILLDSTKSSPGYL